jgi:nitrogen fixation protein FixH
MQQKSIHKSESPWSSPWVLGWIGMIVVVLAVNALMIWLAIDTSPGLVTESYYDHGANYEKTLQKRERRDQLAWNAKLQIPERILVGNPTPIRIIAVDKRGVPLAADTATLYAYRPSDADADFAVQMIIERAGTYIAMAQFPLLGTWDLIASIKHGEDKLDITGRIFADRR